MQRCEDIERTGRIEVDESEKYGINGAFWREDKDTKISHIAVRALTDDFPHRVDYLMQCGRAIQCIRTKGFEEVADSYCEDCYHSAILKELGE